MVLLGLNCNLVLYRLWMLLLRFLGHQLLLFLLLMLEFLRLFQQVQFLRFVRLVQ